jgi:uncharacterized protein
MVGVHSIMVQYFRSLSLALLLSVGVGSVGNAASFDCNKATTETEIAICGDPELSVLDDFMGIIWSFEARTALDVSSQKSG